MTITPIKPFYTTSVKVAGGRSGTAVSDDGVLNLKLKAPGAAGDPAATNPEQLFAAGWGACYQSALMSAAREAGLDASASEVTVDVSLGKEGGNGPYSLAATITVAIPGLEPEQVRELANAAHQRCPYSRATRDNIEVDLVTA